MDNFLSGNPNRRDTPSEQIFSYFLGQLTRIIGAEAVALLPATAVEAARGMARGRQLPNALRSLATVGGFFASDEEPRKAFEGLLNGLAEGLQNVDDDALEGRFNDLMTNSPHVTTLEAAAREGRFERNKKMSYAEAYLRLSQPRKAIMSELVGHLHDGGAHLSAVVSLQELSGLADMAIAAKAAGSVAFSDFAKAARVRVSPERSAPEKAIGDAEKIIGKVKELLRKKPEDGRPSFMETVNDRGKRLRGAVTPSHLIRGGRAPTKPTTTAKK